MKREIKFRAWSKKTKKMYNDVIHVNLNSSEGIWTTVLRNDPFEGKTVHYSIQPEHCEIMQFTGLKDKNGVEIYEGDILKTERNIVEVFNGRKDFDFVFNGIKDVIEVHGWLVRNKNLQIDVLDTSFCAGEIIGNIHENPKLLC